MTQASIVSGVLANGAAEFRTSYPTNLEPIFIDNKISNGQLRSTSGASGFGTGPGADRGGTIWSGTHYRVMGTKLVRVAAGVATTLGDLGGGGPVSFAGSFDRLGIASGGKLYYWTGSQLLTVTDPDLGTVLDAIWVDGYFMTTDGKYVIVTELDDPLQVKPLKYGSAEDDPDPITGLVRVPGSNDTHVVGRYTIQVFQNVGGAGFPFKAVPGATIPFGCVSASAKTLYGKSFAFVGSAVNQALGVYVSGQGDANKISTRAIDKALAAVLDPTGIILESRVSDDELRLFVHLPTESWVFLAKASERAQEPIWYRCQSGIGQPYRIRNAVLDGNRWVVGDLNTPALGYLEDTTEHFGEAAQWIFDVGLIYSPKPLVLHSIELVGLPGRGGDGVIFMSTTRDGETFGVERDRVVGPIGRRNQRLTWRPHIRVSTYLGLRFRGYGTALAGIAACEAG